MGSRKTFKKGLTPWDEFAEQCILGCYSGHDGESVANRKIVIEPETKTTQEKSITRSQQLGKLLERGNIQSLNDLEVFDYMDQLRREMQNSG